VEIDVFFSYVPGLRDELTERMLQHWKGLGYSPIVLTPESLKCSDFDFQSARRIYADATARSGIYILTDDDMECITDPDLGLQAMEEHPDFGIISAFPANCTIQRWTPENYEAFEDLSVSEHVSVGGIRIIRKGALIKGWPPQTEKGYDREHGEAMRVGGYRVGYSQHFRAIHHGEGISTLYPKAEATYA
jgi:hypothetical protein